MKVAVVGAGISGLMAAYELSRGGADVVLYEKEPYIGGHAHTGNGNDLNIDLGFMVFNRITYPNRIELFEKLGVEMEKLDMSFSVSLDDGNGCEWGTGNWITGLFAQKCNAINPYFLRMLSEIRKFKEDTLNYLEEHESNPHIDRCETLEHFIKSHGYSQMFQKAYLVPMCAAIWSCSSEVVMNLSAFSVLSFCHNHHLLQLSGDPQCLTVNPRLQSFIQKSGPQFDDMLTDVNLGSNNLHFLITINPQFTPKHEILKWSINHPIPSVAACKASLELENIQGKRGIWFCGAYQGYGLHEDGLKAGIDAAHSVLGEECILLKPLKKMVPSFIETGARIIVNNFLKRHIVTGSLTLLEEGGAIRVFEGGDEERRIKSVIKVHDPKFYWKIATEADLGLADAYINGYFSFVDKKEGLLDLLRLFITNRVVREFSMKTTNRFAKRGWWKPLLFTSALSSAAYYFRHVLRQNTLTQARRNISHHYDLSNELFSLFLDDTMVYSCAIFKSENEDLNVAQLRKVSLLIEKARINNHHEILEIGCGWGCLAIEAVKQTGCKYTGITLSKEQLHFARRKARDAGLEDRITFLLCDYRQLPESRKYDRIISCEMIEAVGHEYFVEFFGCCESVLAEDGLLVLQFISAPDQKFDEYRRDSNFLKEYIFPGGCLPSMSIITSAMATSSRLCKILALGFNEKFIRTWEYYLIYCAACYKTESAGNYQIVFSRPCSLKAFNGFPAA
ncbi:hypothetical protein J5N97_028805 [Dioscorea zingiberensis]|uniref:Cyclopropane-fatty-acyl-phospholipid synthase n=1 Tax=Dioscorea zingiberensis TaxID=325984 RepID=A0A9D5C060_9LILI|nr:hypothetical protein J5N97_028805 [Dioscorea zingiberensis]